MAKFSVAKRYNTERLFDINTEEFDYKSLEDVYIDDDYVFPVRGIYINTKGIYDPAPVVATDDSYVNLPAHLCDICKSMLNDKAAIKAINDGEVGFTIYKYHNNRFDKDCYSITWVDREVTE